ncbi:NAD(P)/FAD-dependent oxidoreductase [Hydrogenophaga sp.]|uniref:NAD(P)/FAD-dependent oxidoreductase n=1 Tax=Hydrogenophaga sp. TaxID=1904254 RepID=UPI00199454FD|nr:NAD(P)/FAD-dependent oxidoreductase [Hydrogenophaga sp.]MBD3893771.1 flavocytochrome C [Hydrogenophaga sp.]
MKRRQFVHAATATSAIAGLGLLGGCATPGPGAPKVVVVGAGYGGATAAKYLRLFSNQGIDVTLVEPNASFISCPISNLVLGGHKNMAFITHSYENLQRRHGVKLVRDSVTRIDAEQRRVRLAGGGELPYDRLILSPGIDFMWETLPGMASQAAKDKVLHAWKAGPQTAALRQQLQAMPDGGVYALSIPMVPYRCPPGPYERACMVASYFKQAKPRSKVIIFDANDDVTSKRGLFLRAWADHYKDIIEYRPKHRVIDVDAATNTLQFEFNDPFTASVANVVPSQRAGAIAVQSGLATANQRWCEVDFLSFESKAAKHIHVLGDAIQIAPGMPKSGHMANQHAKVCAAAVLSLLQGKEPPSLPLYANTCYSFVTAEEAIHVASVHRFDAAQRTMLTVPGSGGVSSAANELEAFYAIGWARNIWADSLG